jgi:hypothetical protein
VGGGTEAGVLRVTLASDSSGVISVDDNGGTLTVDGTVAVTHAALTELAGAIDTEMQVDVVGALPEGTNNIGDIDVLSVIPGTGATNLGKAEDAAHVSGDVGVMALAVRQSSQADFGADGDYVPFSVDDDGGLRVSIVAGAGSGGTAQADDADFTDGTTQGTPVMGVFESSPSTVTDGDLGIVGITENRELKVAVSSGGVEGIAEDTASAGGEEGVAVLAVRRDTPGSGVGTDGDFAFLSVNSAGRVYTAATIDAAIPAGTNNIGDVDVLTVPADPFGANADAASATGSISAKLRFIAATGIPITALPATTNTREVVGDVAQDAAVAGNPVLVGMRASTATPTPMSADGDSVYAWADRNGAQVVVGNVLDDAAFTPGTNRVTPVGYLADETATDLVDEGDIGAGRITLDRKQIVTPYAHAGAGGHTPYKNLDVDESEDDIKASAGKLFWIHVMNLSNAVRYLKIYNNVAATVVVGTTVPDLTFPIPTMADTNGAGFCLHFGDHGMGFTTGICIAATTGLADNNSGAPGANEVVLNAGYL